MRREWTLMTTVHTYYDAYDPLSDNNVYILEFS
jgi:hypothetical protein